MKVLMTYVYPEQLREGLSESGRTILERVPGHPTRPARATDWNVWWEDPATWPAAKMFTAPPRDKMLRRGKVRTK